MFGPLPITSTRGLQPVIDCFTASGCWCCCPGAKLVQVIVIGGGGGGGNSCNFCTVGCNTTNMPGGGAGGGGGVSVCSFPGALVACVAAVVVGAGGANGIPAVDGGASCFVGGVTLCAGGGQKGQYANINTTQSNGSICPGLGNYACGNQGGGGRALINGCNATNTDSTTRGGGGGGGVRYCNTLPSSCTFTNAGSASSCSDLILPQLTVTIGNRGAGGNGGNGSLNFQRATTGTGGAGGFVQVIQYF